MTNDLEWMTWDSIVQLSCRMSLDDIPLDGRTLRMTRANLDALWKEVRGDWAPEGADESIWSGPKVQGFDVELVD